MRKDHWSVRHPVTAAYILLLIALALRIIDMFVLRTDQRIGEQVLSKVGGLALILVYAWHAKGTLGAIGLHRRRWVAAAALGLGVMAIAQVAGHGAGWLFLRSAGESGAPTIQVESHPAIPQATETAGGLLVTVLLLGNVFNASMEEGLFRGVFITHLGSRTSLRRANLVQGIIFGAWHILVPARAYMDGQMELGMALTMSVVYLVLSSLVGIAWGGYYRATGSLWTPWVAHFINNTTLNFLHLVGAESQPLAMGVITLVVALVSVGFVPIVRSICIRLDMPAVPLWSPREAPQST